jgi:hypothetical protein
MKTRTLILTIYWLLAFESVRAQLYIDDDIYLTAWPQYSIGQGSVWGATHGTPNYTPDEIWMWHRVYSNGTERGEGVYRRVDFHGNGQFQVELGIKEFYNPFSNPNCFVVFLANV